MLIVFSCISEIRRTSSRCKFIPLSNPGRSLMEKEPNGVFFKFFKLLKIKNTGEQELIWAREKCMGQYMEFSLSFSDS